jgi:hypothetical protein
LIKYIVVASVLKKETCVQSDCPVTLFVALHTCIVGFTSVNTSSKTVALAATAAQYPYFTNIGATGIKIGIISTLVHHVMSIFNAVLAARLLTLLPSRLSTVEFKGALFGQIFGAFTSHNMFGIGYI